VSAAVTSFALLADPTRVRMLWALREAELDVATLAAESLVHPWFVDELARMVAVEVGGAVEQAHASRRISVDEWRDRPLAEKLWERAAALLGPQI